jgi:AcrR family transcriptional regulator
MARKGKGQGKRGRQVTREKILEAATGVFAEKGYYEALVDEIAQVSKTSKGAIYFHFPSKEGLFAALMERLAERLLADVEGAIARKQGAVAKVQAALETVMEQLVRRRRLAKILLVQSLHSPAFTRKRLELFERFARLIEKHLDEAIAEGSIAPIDSEVVAHAWLGAIYELTVRWLYTDELPLERALPTLSQLLLRSIGISPTDPAHNDLEGSS